MTDKTPGKPREIPGKPRETPGKPGETPAKPGENPVNPDKTPVKPDETPVNPDKTPVKPGETPVKPGKTPAKPGKTPVKPGKTPVNPDKGPAKPGETPAKPGKTPVKPGENPFIPDKTPAKPGETPAKPVETPVKPGETPVKPGKTPGKPGETPAKPNENAAKRRLAWRERFAPRQMFAGPTPTKTATNDGYFGKFSRMFVDDPPLWVDKKKMAMREERLVREERGIKYVDNIGFKMYPDEWYGTFGPHLEAFDPKPKEVEKVKEPPNFYTSVTVDIPDYQKYPPYVEEPYEADEYVEGEMTLPKIKKTSVKKGKWGNKRTNVVKYKRREKKKVEIQKFATTSSVQPFFDPNPNRRPYDFLWREYLYFLPHPWKKDHKFGLYNNYATRQNEGIDPANCFSPYPQADIAPYIDRIEFDQNYKEPDKKNMKYGTFVRFPGGNRSTWDRTNPFNPYPEHSYDKYVDPWKMDLEFSKRPKYVGKMAVKKKKAKR